ncbi:MAG TPA: peptidoglycan DD-metalloendopeptidase family protein [Steroidobacteraceae bacterium]|nr:peptidoglycan DD-metalloendopeptidase family protein [Steroidobacteraceae bacterium]
MRRETNIALDYKPAAERAGTLSHARWLVSGLALPLFGGVVAYKLVDTPSTPPAAIEVVQPAAEPVAGVAPPAPVQAAQPDPVLGHTIEFVVRQNDTMDRIFRHLDLSLGDLADIRNLPGVRESLDRLRPGDLITFVHENGIVSALKQRISDTEILSVTRADDGFSAKVIETPLEIRTAEAHGTIDSSLFVAARAAGLSSEVILKLANEVFGWDIDFALDIQPGDQFTVLYEQKFRDGEYVADGNILAADFTSAGKLHRAVRFESADGKIADYFAPDGRSMRRQFLRAPLDFTRVSSDFNPYRRHPILNTIRAHKGVDYAAPTGTVIKAAGEGRVAFAGTQGGYGRVVILEHGGGVSTLYGHMSRFAQSMRQGKRVRQGETIGFVGSTGAATGPHLHYEYRVNGVHQNPRTVPLPQALPIPPEYRQQFDSTAGQMLTELDRARSGGMVASGSNAEGIRTRTRS